MNVFAEIEHTQRLAVELRDGQAGLLTVATDCIAISITEAFATCSEWRVSEATTTANRS